MTNIPLNPSQVTKEWLTLTLQEKGWKEVQVNELQPIKNEGGVLSCLFKAKINLENKQDVKLFIKIMPPADQPQRVFIENFGIDKREVDTYEIIFKELTDFEKSLNQNTRLESIHCKYFSGDCCLEKKNRGYYLILEDISDSFKMLDFAQGLNDECIKDSLEKLAHLHSLSFCYSSLKNVDWKKRFPMTYHSFLEDKECQDFVDSLFVRASEQLRGINEDKLAKVLDDLSRNYVDKFKMGYGGQDGRFLTHGDLWCNNMMFNECNECIFIDWQFACGSSPILDIAAMAFMNQEPSKVEQNMKGFFRCYFEKFQKICLSFNVPMPWKDFEEFENVTLKEGFLSLFVWLLVSFSPCVYHERILNRFAFIFHKAMELNPAFFELE